MIKFGPADQWFMADDMAAPSDSATREIPERSWFDRTASWIVAGSVAMGALRSLRTALSAGAFDLLSWVDALAGAGYAILAHGLAGLTLAALVRALGAWARSAGERPSGQQRGETPASAATLEREAARASVDEDMAAVRRAIERGEWGEADDRLRGLLAERPDDHRVAALADDLSRAKRAVGERWAEQLRAAREVNDPNRVLELYERTPLVHDDEGRKALDQDLARWFLTLVHHRLRGGGVQLEIVTLVERVAESFGHTVEGASLRASLPTLRRSVGLCPRCGQPFAGTADACPTCLAGNAPARAESATTEPATESEPEQVDEPAMRRRDSEWFVDRDDEDSPT